MSDTPNQAPRCQYINPRGRRCGSPAMRGKDLCYQHDKYTNLSTDPRNVTAFIPVLDSGESMQIAVTNILRALAADAIEVKKAYAMLYGLQLMGSALRHCDSTPLDEAAAEITPAMERALQLEMENEQKLKSLPPPPAAKAEPRKEPRSAFDDYQHLTEDEMFKLMGNCPPDDVLGTPQQICNHVRLMLHYRLRKYGKPSPAQVKAAFEQISEISRMDYDRIKAYLEMWERQSPKT